MLSWVGKLLATVALIWIAVYAFVRYSPAISISSLVSQKQNLFTVSGQGKVTVIPDTGIISLGINLSRPTVAAAQNEVNTVMDKITTALKNDLAIEAKDIKTTNYSVYPQYDYQGTPNRITGYNVSANISVTVRKIDDVNKAIDTATQFGANSVGAIQFTVNEEKQKTLLKQAREEAVKEAKAKAESLAASAGLTLGRIVNIEESGASTAPRPVYAAKDMAVGMGGGSVETSVQPGSTDIVSYINLSYETR